MSLSITQKTLIGTLGLFAIATFALVTEIAPKASIKPVAARTHSDTPAHAALIDRPQPLAHAGSCVASADPATPPAMLRQMRDQVFASERRQAYTEAVPQIRNLAAVDPGSPGVNLDLSMSLLELKQFQQAKEALDAQIVISECLANLPSQELSAYCNAEAFQPDLGRCREELDGILRNAKLGQGLIVAELRTPALHESAQLPPVQSLSATPQRPVATRVRATAPRSTRESADRNLAMGIGTDAQLGAYSK